MPRPVYQFHRSCIQYSCHFSSSPGLTKNSISICSNSRVRKMKLPGVISLRNDLPIWAMPNGGLRREVVCTWAKLTKMPCAVSGRRYATEPASWVGPRWVWSMPENCLGSVNAPFVPQCGQLRSARPSAGGLPCLASYASSRWSAR